MLNIQQLSFLVGSLNNMIQTFGSKPETYNFFKDQVFGLIDAGQMGRVEANTIFELLDLQNDNSKPNCGRIPEVINDFMAGMNYMLQAQTKEERISCLAYLKTSDKLNSKVEKAIRVSFDLQNVKAINFNAKTNNNGFGNLNSINNLPKNVPDKSWSDFALKYYEAYAKVTNLDAVCSGDPSYITVQISNLTNTNISNTARFLEMLKRTGKAKLVKIDTSSCSHETIPLPDATEEFNRYYVHDLIAMYNRERGK